ncbi:MAG TPA: trypsin-like peptidase domain-containing protein [Candidatus Binatia bacterium]|jgi:S1-C subfamily serine protease
MLFVRLSRMLACALFALAAFPQAAAAHPNTSAATAARGNDGPTRPGAAEAVAGPRGEAPGRGDKGEAPARPGAAAESPALRVPDVAPASIESSVVRVLVYANPPDFFSPWQKTGTQASSGSGVIIDGHRILTNAHVVADAVGVEVKRAGSGDQYEAAVSYVGHDCDLALLTVSDEHFFDDSRPLPVSELPTVNANVQTYGFPVGGETLSVTSGVISRIEVGTYTHSKERLLIAQFDAPINPGNSGGPVIRDGAVVGVAMQMLEQAENVGYMVPAPVVRHFLSDVEDGKYDGFPHLGAQLQPLESPALRSSLGLGARQSGALVTRVDFGSPAQGILERGDVVTSIGGYPVADDLTVAMPGVGRVAMDAVVGSRQVGQTLGLTVLRGGDSHDVEVTLARSTPLVPGRRVGEEPEYFLFGGAVFQPLTGEYFDLYDEVSPHLGAYVDQAGAVTADRRQVVLLSAVLPDPVMRGYLDWESVVVRTVNGQVPRDLAHFADIVDHMKDPYLRIETEDGLVMVLDVQAVKAATPHILDKYGIPHDRSTNLRPGATASAKSM